MKIGELKFLREFFFFRIGGEFRFGQKNSIIE